MNPLAILNSEKIVSPQKQKLPPLSNDDCVLFWKISSGYNTISSFKSTKEYDKSFVLLPSWQQPQENASKGQIDSKLNDLTDL